MFQILFTFNKSKKNHFFLDSLALTGYTGVEDRVVRRKVLASFQAFLR